MAVEFGTLDVSVARRHVGSEAGQQLNLRVDVMGKPIHIGVSAEACHQIRERLTSLDVAAVEVRWRREPPIPHLREEATRLGQVVSPSQPLDVEIRRSFAEYADGQVVTEGTVAFELALIEELVGDCRVVRESRVACGIVT